MGNGKERCLLNPGFLILSPFFTFTGVMGSVKTLYVGCCSCCVVEVVGSTELVCDASACIGDFSKLWRMLNSASISSS